MSEAFDVGGPVLAELFVLWGADDGVHLTGPCGPAPWYVEVAEGQDPQAVALSLLTRQVGPPLLVHSTSWRRDRTGVVLSFAAVIPVPADPLDSVLVERAELARGGAAEAAGAIAANQVLEHALRHLAWLMQDDLVVKETLAGSAWPALLAGYLPEPFRHLA